MGRMHSYAAGGSGRFTEVVLRPRVTVATPAMADAAKRLHADASAKCFIANSVSFPVKHEPTIEVATATRNDNRPMWP